MIIATADVMRFRDGYCRRNYMYSVEPFNLLRWRSHLSAVESGQPWAGPCGDLTATVLDILTSTNYADPVSLDRCYRILVSIDGGDAPDHIVGAVQTDDDGFLIVGDTVRPAYPHTIFSYKAFEYNRLSEAGLKPIWREGTPW